VDTDALAAIECIKILKARYFRFMDSKRWDEWGDLLTDGCQAMFNDHDWIAGRDRIVDYVRTGVGEGVTFHQGFMPEIELTGPTTAMGIWAMSDYVEGAGDRATGSRAYGHYEEVYEKGADDRWRIARLQLSRYRVDPIQQERGLREID
jgi:SnoaL-like domain